MSRGRGKKINPLAAPVPREGNPGGIRQFMLTSEEDANRRLARALAAGDTDLWEQVFQEAILELGSTWRPHLTDLVIDASTWKDTVGFSRYAGGSKFELVDVDLTRVTIKNIKASAMVIRNSIVTDVTIKDSDLRNFIFNKNKIKNFHLEESNCELGWISELKGDGFKLSKVSLNQVELATSHLTNLQFSRVNSVDGHIRKVDAPNAIWDNCRFSGGTVEDNNFDGIKIDKLHTADASAFYRNNWTNGAIRDSSFNDFYSQDNNYTGTDFKAIWFDFSESYRDHFAKTTGSLYAKGKMNDINLSDSNFDILSLDKAVVTKGNFSQITVDQIDWNGQFFDCDFNELEVTKSEFNHLVAKFMTNASGGKVVDTPESLRDIHS